MKISRRLTQQVSTLVARAGTLLVFPLLALVLTVVAAAQTITFDYPGAMGTFIKGINDKGLMVGSYWSSDGAEHGFLYDGNNYRLSFDYPNAMWTEAAGIDQNGNVVGFYGIVADNLLRGFLRTASGAFQSLDIPGRFNFMPEGINSSNTIVGCMHNPGTMHGWIMQNGALATISPAYRMYQGINATGTIVGWYYSAPSKLIGFILNGSGETSFSYPNANFTDPWGINDYGDVVGGYGQKSSNHGFLLHNGKFTSIDIEGAAATIALGINNSGQIVGVFGDANNTSHGFIADAKNYEE